jgi:two-component system, OmpR family, KDP operon response regulator KdpE
MSKETTLRILIVDDEPEIRRFLRASLRTHKHEVLEAATGAAALQSLAEYHPDLMILDLGLPDSDGVDVIRQARRWSQAPVIILSVRDRENDKIEALDAGADDYLTKPFSMGELMARIRGVMRRVIPDTPDPVYRNGELALDLAKRQVTRGGHEISLTPTEFELLHVLMASGGRVVTQRQLIHRVWGAAYEDESRLLRVNISNLRHKIEPLPNRPTYILTELGIGYRIRDDSS